MNCGHTLDLLITREHDPVICSAPVADRYLSDRASMLCTLNSLKPGHVVKELSYRKLKSFDLDSLRSDLEKSELCTRDFSYLCQLMSSYNSTLSSLLDKHAPPLKKKVISRQRVTWFNSDIKGAIRARRRAERKWGNTNSQLFEPTDVPFPDHIPPDDLANIVGSYLVQKIELINDSLDALRSSEPLDGASDASADNVGACANCVDPDPRECVEFPNFKTLTQDQVSLLLERQP